MTKSELGQVGVENWRKWAVPGGLALAVLVILAGLHAVVAIPRDGAIGKYGGTRWVVTEDLDLRPDGTYAYSFYRRVGVEPRVGVEFILAGRWDFERHMTVNVVILRDFIPGSDGAQERKRDWRFTLTEDSGLYRLQPEDSSCDWQCIWYEKPAK